MMTSKSMYLPRRQMDTTYRFECSECSECVGCGSLVLTIDS